MVLWKFWPFSNSELIPALTKIIVCFILPDILFKKLIQFREKWVDKVYLETRGTWKRAVLPNKRYMVAMFWKWNVNDFINWRIDHGYTLDLPKYPSKGILRIFF
jgi:hypothetical protein